MKLYALTGWQDFILRPEDLDLNYAAMHSDFKVHLGWRARRERMGSMAGRAAPGKGWE
jgi:hypothetical protein